LKEWIASLMNIYLPGWGQSGGWKNLSALPGRE
jgi:hypothetical protein